MENDTYKFGLILFVLLLLASFLGVRSAKAQSVTNMFEVDSTDNYVLKHRADTSHYTLYISETQLVELMRGEIYSLDPNLTPVETVILDSTPSNYTWRRRYESHKYSVVATASCATNSIIFKVTKKDD